MARLAPVALADDFDNYPASYSIPPTPSPGSAAVMRFKEGMMRTPQRGHKAPPALNDDLFGTPPLAYDVPPTPSPNGAALLAAAGTLQMSSFAHHSISVSLGAVQVGIGVSVPITAHSSAKLGMRDAGISADIRPPPGVFVQRARVSAPPPPPPTNLPPRFLHVQDASLIELPPAPMHLPQCTKTDADIAAGPSQHGYGKLGLARPTQGSGALLAKQLAQKFDEEAANTELKVRNTFLDGGCKRSPSLERLLMQMGRQAQSCPGSRLPTPRGRNAETMGCLTDIEPGSSTASTADASEFLLEDHIGQNRYATSLPSLQAAAWRNSPSSRLVHLQKGIVKEMQNAKHLHLDQAAPTGRAGRKPPRVLQLEHVLAFEKTETAHVPIAGFASSPAPLKTQPEVQTDKNLTNPPRLGSAELPSLGSLGHHIHRCKPCAFFNRMGCSNGSQCNFCHLCTSGEKKRRRKEKRALIGAARRLMAAEKGPDETVDSD
jgi:hypothetical protein